MCLFEITLLRFFIICTAINQNRKMKEMKEGKQPVSWGLSWHLFPLGMEAKHHQPHWWQMTRTPTPQGTIPSCYPRNSQCAVFHIMTLDSHQPWSLALLTEPQQLLDHTILATPMLSFPFPSLGTMMGELLQGPQCSAGVFEEPRFSFRVSSLLFAHS